MRADPPPERPMLVLPCPGREAVMTEYRKTADGWLVFCPYCNVSEVFDQADTALDAGLEHSKRCHP